MNALGRPLGFEQRESVKVLVLVRWVLLAALLAVIDYPLRSDTRAAAVIGVFLLVALGANLALQVAILRGRAIPLWAPLALGAFDAAAITGAIAVVAGFDNPSYVLYYPALMAFSALFPGRIGMTYGVAVIATYAFLSVAAYQRFDRTSAADWHNLGLRIVTMVAAVALSYLLVRVERQRRLRAVAAEAQRQGEVFALEERARETERAADDERKRLVRDLHDGVSQGVYMLSLGLEGAAHQLTARGGASPTERERLDALVRLSKQTLLEARGLLFDLSEVMQGDGRLDALVAHQADEFRAITGIAATVTVEGVPRALPATTVAGTYRVIQETLANVYRHAGASHVALELHSAPDHTTLRIADDGAGFEPAEAHQRGHGLRTMRERAELMGAHLEVVSACGAGAAVTLTIPGGSEGACP